MCIRDRRKALTHIFEETAGCLAKVGYGEEAANLPLAKRRGKARWERRASERVEKGARRIEAVAKTEKWKEDAEMTVQSLLTI